MQNPNNFRCATGFSLWMGARPPLAPTPTTLGLGTMVGLAAACNDSFLEFFCPWQEGANEVQTRQSKEQSKQFPWRYGVFFAHAPSLQGTLRTSPWKVRISWVSVG